MLITLEIKVRLYIIRATCVSGTNAIVTIIHENGEKKHSVANATEMALSREKKKETEEIILCVHLKQ